MTHSSDSGARVLVDAQASAGGTLYRLTVDNPTKLNTLSTPVLMAFGEALERVAADPDARVVVLRGSGEKAWIGGADIREMSEFDRDAAVVFIRRLHRICRGIRELAVPVVGRISGYCLGAGLEVAACCDLRVASRDSAYGMPEVQVGLPSVIEAAVLPRLIGIGRTRDLVLTGRVIDASEAFAYGLVETVVAPEALDDTVEDRVERILSAGPRAVRIQKRLCRVWEETSITGGVQAGIEALAEAFETDEPTRYLERFLQRPR